MSAGRFTYYHKIGGVTVAELDCRFEVNGRTGDFTVYMQDILSADETEPDEYFRDVLESHVVNKLAIELQEARTDAACGVYQHDRETERAPI
jgi:hypothetical protein